MERQTKRTTINALAIILFATSQLLAQWPAVTCQDFEDLNKQQQSPLSRQPQAAAQRQRPVLSSRFVAAPAAGQQLVAQPSSNSVAFSPAGGSSSNIEQMMKNALARTSQLNAAAAVAQAEPRLDLVGAATAAGPAEAAAQSRGSSAQPAAVSSAAGGASKPAESDRRPESSEFAASSSAASTGPADEDKQTTVPVDAGNGHETVYGDQRFASLFARRNNARKAARFQPSEQVKAKPTLPSFIKSPPDPKQFSAAAAQAFNDGVPGTRGSAPLGGQAGSLVSKQQQQQQRKAAAAITSNSAASASSRRAAAKSGPAAPAAPPKASALSAKPLVAASKPAPASANPFSRPAQASAGQDPASVIAMARKRLLANNALESAKLKQQQQAAASKPAPN